MENKKETGNYNEETLGQAAMLKRVKKEAEKELSKIREHFERFQKEQEKEKKNLPPM